MQWYYAEGDRQLGPISEAELQQLVTSGKVQAESLVWREGMDTWRPYHSVATGGATPVAATPPPVISMSMGPCAECGRSFSFNDMVRIQNSWVCAACKPIFLQRLNEGAAPPVSLAIWRSGKMLVTSKENSVFPDRCVKCNAPVQGKMKRTLYWYPPYVIIIILISLLIGLIVAMIVRKTAKVEVGLCDVHRRKRIQNMILGAFLGVGGFIALVSSIGLEKGWVAIVGIAALITGIVFMVKATLLSAKKMDDRHVWINGVCKPYLDMLPEWRDGF